MDQRLKRCCGIVDFPNYSACSACGSAGGVERTIECQRVSGLLVLHAVWMRSFQSIVLSVVGRARLTWLCPCNHGSILSVKQEPEDPEEPEVDDDKNNEVFLEQCSFIKKEEMEDDVDDDCIAYGEMQNEEVLPDSFPVPVGRPMRIEEEYEEDPSTSESFTVPATVPNNSSKDYILPDDGAVFPLFLKQQSDVLRTRMSHHILGQQATRTPNQESSTPTISPEKPSFQLGNKPKKSSFIDISPVSNENLSERAKEVLKRLARICPKVDKRTHNIVSKKVQNSLMELDVNTNMQTSAASTNHITLTQPQMKQVSIRTEEVLSKSQAWGSVVILGAVTGHQSQNQMLTLGPMAVTTQQQKTGPGVFLEKAAVQSQQELGQFMRVTTVPVPTHQGLSQMTSVAAEPTLLQQGLGQVITVATDTPTIQQQGLNGMISIAAVPSQTENKGLSQIISVTNESPATQLQGLNGMISVATVPAQPKQQKLGPLLTIRTLNTSNQQENSVNSRSSVRGQTHRQIVMGHAIALGSQTQEQRIGQIMPATASINCQQQQLPTTNQGSGRLISIAPKPAQPQEVKVLGQLGSVENDLPTSQQQGLNQIMSIATVPAQANEKGLVSVMSVGAMSVPTSHQVISPINSVQTDPRQTLHHAMPVETVTISAPLQAFGSILAKTPLTPVTNATATVPASGPVKASTSASGPLQAPTWTSSAPSVAPHLMRVEATKQEHGQAPAQVQTLTPVRVQALDPTAASSPPLLPKVVQQIAPTPMQDPTQAQAPVQTSVSMEAVTKSPLLVKALSSAFKGIVEPVRTATSNSTPASVQVSPPTCVQRSVPAASSISQEDLNLGLAVKMYKIYTKNEDTKAPGPWRM
ncbi:Protein of unknown function [Gryllus bimaculatus]|nr:Protein of unknown function [Gryllus bimaculatus]